MELSIVLGPIIAFGASALLFLFASVVAWGAGEARAARGVKIAAPALLLAAVLAGWSLAGLPWSMAPRQAFAWLPVLLALAALGAIIAEEYACVRGVAPALAAVLFFASLNAGVGKTWDLSTVGAWLLGSVAVAVAGAKGAADLLESPGLFRGIVALGVITALAAALVLATGNEQQSRTPALLAAGLGGAFVVMLVLRRSVLGGGAGVMWSGAMQAVLTQACTLGETRWYAAVLVMLAPLAAARAGERFAHNRPATRGMLTAGAGVALVLAAFLTSIPQIRGG